MKISFCPKCNEHNGTLVFRTTRKNNRKYPYVGHYDPSKKSKKRWCSLGLKKVLDVTFDGDWYYEYILLMREMKKFVKEHDNDINTVPETKLDEVADLLEKNGYLKYLIADKIYHDVYHVLLPTTKEIEDTLRKSGFYDRH